MTLRSRSNIFKICLAAHNMNFSFISQRLVFIISTMIAYGVCQEAQWISGRLLDSRPVCPGFEPHRRHCVVFFEQDTFILA